MGFNASKFVELLTSEVIVLVLVSLGDIKKIVLLGLHLLNDT